MQALNEHDRRVAALSRAARAAIVVPSLFALALVVIRQPAAAGFAVFGTFAHQVLVDYEPAGRTRFAQAAMLTLLGVITVTLGTLASPVAWLAVGGTLAAGFLAELPALASRRVAPVGQALLLSFLCAVAVPAPARLIAPHVAGWLLAGIVAQPSLLLIWFSLPRSDSAGVTSQQNDNAARAIAGERFDWLPKAIHAGLAFSLVVLLTRVARVDHAFWVILGVLPVLNTKIGAARTFWQQQAGTVLGYAIGALVVAIVGGQQVWYWLILPLCVFGSAYASTAVGLLAGQAAYTVFVVVMFCILIPQERASGIARLEDIAIGGAVSLAVASLLRLGNVTPRGRTAP